MPRTARTAKGGFCYHVLNRGNERQTVFHSDNEYASFLQLLQSGREHQPMRILSLCLMPNHFHLCLWPIGDGNLGRYMQWLMSAHVAQYRKTYPGSGHIWQGRYKAFPVQGNGHLLTVMRYIERNPVRAGLVDKAAEWAWSSAYVRKLPVTQTRNMVSLDEGPVRLPPDWDELLQVPEPDSALAAMRRCVKLGVPFGDLPWVSEVSAAGSA